MPAEIEPPELARLVDFAERPRIRDWSLRSALVRYAQPEPQRVNDILELVRRVDAALGKNAAALANKGPAFGNALEQGGEGPDPYVMGVLRAARELDALGEVLAGWAVDRAGDRPNADVDRVVADVAEQLDALGVPREERPPGPRNRGT
jgi:hypothetical protein